MKAVLALFLALGGCALVVLIGPGSAEALLGWLGDDFGSSEKRVETLFVLIIYGSLFAIALVAGLAMRTRPFKLGRSAIGAAPIGAALGCLGIAASVTYSWIAGTLVQGQAGNATALALLSGSALVLFQATSEEVYFRGWLQTVLATSWGVAPALVISSLAFAALHFLGGARTPVALTNIFLGGMIFGWLTVRTGGIAAAILAHFSWNWIEKIGLGLVPNPGVGTFGALRDFDLRGPAIWGGSEQGLNDSIAMTAALLALMIPLLVLSFPSRKSPASRTPARVDAVAKSPEGLERATF